MIQAVAAVVEGLKTTAVELSKNVEGVRQHMEKLLQSPDAQTSYEGMQLNEVPNDAQEVPLTNEFGQKIAEVPITEKQLYDVIGLHPKEINGKDVLIRDDIDPNLVDARGRTNLERMESGLSPIDETGKEYELHHIRQEANGPLAELTHSEHHGNFELLHPHPNSNSEIDRAEFAKIRAEHWKARAEMMNGGLGS